MQEKDSSTAKLKPNNKKMIILIVTRNGFDELKLVIETGKYSVWIAEGVVSEVEKDALREKNIDFSYFNYSIDPKNKKDIECALQTISEHHPNERVWLECQL